MDVFVEFHHMFHGEKFCQKHLWCSNKASQFASKPTSNMKETTWMINYTNQKIFKKMPMMNISLLIYMSLLWFVVSHFLKKNDDPTRGFLLRPCKRCCGNHCEASGSHWYCLWWGSDKKLPNWCVCLLTLSALKLQVMVVENGWKWNLYLFLSINTFFPLLRRCSSFGNKLRECWFW